MSKAKEEFYKWFGEYEHLGESEAFECVPDIYKFDYIQELKEQKTELIKLVEYCCYEEDFDADFLIQKLKEITNE